MATTSILCGDPVRRGLAVLVLLGAGCASSGGVQPPVLAEQEPAAAPSGRAGRSLSQWLDRTSSIASKFPPAGEDCAAIYDPERHRLVLFGGKTDDDKNVNEVWALDLDENIWHQVEVRGETPPKSEDHAVIYDPIGRRMILHGGEDGLTTNKTWALDLRTSRWRNITDPASPGREDHSAVFDVRRKRMVIFGGRNNTGRHDYSDLFDVQALDLDPASPAFEKWQELAAEDTHPRGRSDHVAVYDQENDRMVIHGGWNKDKKEYLGDTWAFHFAAPADKRWQQIKSKKSSPPKRRHAVGAWDSARNWFVICGGFGEEGYLNDVWALDLTADVWLNITPGPQPRLDHQAIYDPRSQRVMVYGGDARLKGKFHDVWELQVHADIPLEELLKEAGAKTVTRPGGN